MPTSARKLYLYSTKAKSSHTLNSYTMQVWSPHLMMDANELEEMQRRITKLVPKLRHLPYESRLKEKEITMLEKRRKRGDITETFKTIKEIDKVDKTIVLQFNPNVRGNQYIQTIQKKKKKVSH